MSEPVMKLKLATSDKWVVVVLHASLNSSGEVVHFSFDTIPGQERLAELATDFLGADLFNQPKATDK